MKGRAESTYRYTVIDTIGGGAPRSRRTSSPGAGSASRRTSEPVASATGRCSTASPCSTSRASAPPRARRAGSPTTARRVVKVGPPPEAAGVQIAPPFYAYSGAPRHAARAARPQGARAGATRSSASPTRADVVIESFRPGVVDRLGIGYDAVRGREPGHRLLLDERLRPGRPARAVGRPRPQLPRGRRLPRLLRAATADGGPPLPGATVADSAGGGMHAVIAILAALVRRATHRRGRVPRRVGRRRRARAHVAARRRVPRDRRGARARPRPPHRPLRLLRRVPRARRQVARGRRDRAAASSPTSAARSAASSGSTHQTDDAVQDEIRADFRAAFATRDRDEWVGRARRRPTRASPPVAVGARARATTRTSRRAARSSTRQHPDHGDVPPGRAGARGHGPPRRPVRRCATRPSPTPTRCSRAAGFTAAEIAALREEGVVA